MAWDGNFDIKNCIPTSLPQGNHVWSRYLPLDKQGLLTSPPVSKQSLTTFPPLGKQNLPTSPPLPLLCRKAICLIMKFPWLHCSWWPLFPTHLVGYCTQKWNPVSVFSSHVSLSNKSCNCPMKLLGKIIMFSTLNNNLSIICFHIWLYSNTKEVYLNSDRPMCIKTKN